MYHNFYSKYRHSILMLIDAILISISFIGAFWLRFDFAIPPEYFSYFSTWLPVTVGIHLIIFNLSGFYKVIWRFTSLWELINIVKVVSTGFAVIIVGFWFMAGFDGFPRSIFLLNYFLAVSFISISRIFVRIYFSHFQSFSKIPKNRSQKRIILIGAGRTGDKIAREVLNTRNSLYKIVGFVDDDPHKKGAILHGYKVLGRVDELTHLTLAFDEILITAPTATGDQIRQIIKECKATGKVFKTVPGLAELIDKDVSIKMIRDVSYTDLLRRDEVKLDKNSIGKLLKGKRVLITGAGGSIGSELVRQCLTFNPSKLICVDNCEENLFTITNESEKIKANTLLKPVLGDVRDKIHLEKIFNDNRPQIVLHAAAYKHVPIQELHPWAAVKTNVGGTVNMVQYSDKYKVEKFVLVSTDKAVNPVNVMGATKRLAERCIQSINKTSDTEYFAVRFGNVIGSSGSAIPTFQKQINTGGPVTITHPEMSRYFMSIPEASQLILQAAAIGGGGKIFLLEMGKPIKIVQIARDLIRLSGFEPDHDIPIVYTGLRPGEKLYEELQTTEENVIHTDHKKIMILKDGNHVMEWVGMVASTNELLNISEKLESEEIQLHLKQMLPDYSPGGHYAPISTHPPVDPFSIKGQA